MALAIRFDGLVQRGEVRDYADLARLGDLPPENESRSNVTLGRWIMDSQRGGFELGAKKHTAEEIIGKLREAEVMLAKGHTVPDVCRKLGVTDQTYYRWRKEYGGLKRDQAKKLKDLERENARLKKLVADLSLDNAILREAAQGNF
jgi:transposase-like protein